MLQGPIVNTFLALGAKLISNLVNHHIEKSNRAQELSAADNAARLEAQTRIIEENAKSPFVQVTRRILFLTITFTFCWIVIHFVQDPSVDWTVQPDPEGNRLGFLSYLTGSKTPTTHAGALLVASFVDLMFTMIGFYAIRSNRK